ncbi:MAG: DUF58 domain-containing protein [Gemmataceae bacterium]|nr:DUF58 domain-containing protein [Gemmataceae bacterium]
MKSLATFDPSLLARFGKLALLARRVVEGFLSGLHQSPYKGFSIEFAEHRQYFPGDEIRHIDWRVYGKTDRFFIKEYEEEANLRAHILLDASGSMAYRGSRHSRAASAERPSKLEYATWVAASLSYLMLHQRDAVGLLVHDHKVRSLIAPHAGSKQLLRLLQTLQATAAGGETALAPIWHHFAYRLARRGLIVILSDCFDRLPDLLLALRNFRHRGQDVLLLHVVAPEEIDFPFRSVTQFRDLESPNHRVVLDAAQARQDYLQAFTAFCDSLRVGARNLEIDYHLLRTDQPVERALGHYLAKRLARSP